MKHSYQILICIWITLLGIACDTESENEKHVMTFRQCLNICMSRNYHGATPSTMCSFGRSANYKQTWNGPPVKVDPQMSEPRYGQMARYDEKLPAGDVSRTSRTISRVIRGILHKKKTVSTLSTSISNPVDYVTVCYNCITGTCRSFLFFG